MESTQMRGKKGRNRECERPSEAPHSMEYERVLKVLMMGLTHVKLVDVAHFVIFQGKGRVAKWGGGVLRWKPKSSQVFRISQTQPSRLALALSLSNPGQPAFWKALSPE